MQDEFTPFEGNESKRPNFRLRDLPWPRYVLGELGESDVEFWVILSYFVEPVSSRRGWRQRYSYASHALRFELQDALESQQQFVQRINGDAQDEESGRRPAANQMKWLVGPNQRNVGSLHQDVWATSGVELSRSGRLAVYPVGGWWKNQRRDRVNNTVRYALIVSLKTPEAGVDLYTPVPRSWASQWKLRSSRRPAACYGPAARAPCWPVSLPPQVTPLVPSQTCAEPLKIRGAPANAPVAHEGPR